MQMIIGIFNPTLCLVLETKMKVLSYVHIILEVSKGTCRFSSIVWEWQFDLSASVVLQKFFKKDMLGQPHWLFVQNSSGGTTLSYEIFKLHVDTFFIVQTGAHF